MNEPMLVVLDPGRAVSYGNYQWHSRGDRVAHVWQTRGRRVAVVWRWGAEDLIVRLGLQGVGAVSFLNGTLGPSRNL